MSNNACDKVLAAIMSEPWAILPERLEQIVAIAGRLSSDMEAALAMKAERGGSGLSSWQGKTAVIPVFGPIFPRASWFDMISGATSLDMMTAQLNQALADPEVDSILFNFDSPGGQATGINEFATRIREAGKQKPVTAYVSGMAASAAYWLACAAGRIVADRTAFVGSIGTICAWTDDSAARKAQGLKDYVLVSSQSPRKHLDPKSPEGMSELQCHLDELAAIFIEQVAEYRDTTANKVETNFGGGGVLLAEAGLKVGMIDSIGGLDDAMKETTAKRRTKGIGMKGQDMALTTMAANGKVKTGDGKKKPEDDEEEKPAGKAESETSDDDDEDGDGKKPENKAQTDDSADDEGEDDDQEEKVRSRKLAKKAKAEHPDLYEAAYKAGVEDERARIRAIRDLNLPGHKALVGKAMFDKPMTAQELALAYVQADQQLRQAGMDARLDESKALKTPAAAIDPGANDSQAGERAMLVRAMAGLPIEGA